MKCKGIDKVILISDCIMAGGMPNGRYSLGGLGVIVKDGEARVESGSTLTMDVAFKNAIEVLDLSINEAVKLCSTNAAKEFNLLSKGQIKEGYDADILILNEDYSINSIFIAGKKLNFGRSSINL